MMLDKLAITDTSLRDRFLADVDSSPVKIGDKTKGKEITIFGGENHHIKGGRFGSKVGQIGPKLDKVGTFSDHISVHLAQMSQMY